jgi:hypothetical protein
MTSGFRTVRASQRMCGGGKEGLGGDGARGRGGRRRRRQRWWKRLTKYWRGPVGMYVRFTQTHSTYSRHASTAWRRLSRPASFPGSTSGRLGRIEVLVHCEGSPLAASLLDLAGGERPADVRAGREAPGRTRGSCLLSRLKAQMIQIEIKITTRETWGWGTGGG